MRNVSSTHTSTTQLPLEEITPTPKQKKKIKEKRGRGRPKKNPFLEKKEKIYLELDKNQILDLKRFLFQHGLTTHQFVGYVIQQAGVSDDRILELAKEALDYKHTRIREQQRIRKQEVLDPHDLYRLIEERVSKIQENQNFSSEEEEKEEAVPD